MQQRHDPGDQPTVHTPWTGGPSRPTGSMWRWWLLADQSPRWCGFALLVVVVRSDRSTRSDTAAPSSTTTTALSSRRQPLCPPRRQPLCPPRRQPVRTFPRSLLPKVVVNHGAAPKRGRFRRVAGGGRCSDRRVLRSVRAVMSPSSQRSGPTQSTTTTALRTPPGPTSPRRPSTTGPGIRRGRSRGLGHQRSSPVTSSERLRRCTSSSRPSPARSTAARTRWCSCSTPSTDCRSGRSPRPKDPQGADVPWHVRT